MAPFPAQTPVASADHYFTIAELREHVTDVNAFPDPKLETARLWAEQRIEHPEAAGVAYVPRTQVETLYPTGEQRIWLNWPRIRSLTSVSVDGVELSAEELTAVRVENMSIWREGGWGSAAAAKVVITYEHGYDAPSELVKRAAIMLAREYLVQNTPLRATGESTDVGFIRYTLAASGGKTGIPEVDAILADERSAARGGRVFVG